MSIDNKLLEDELSEFCQSDSLSLDGLHEIIERHVVHPIIIEQHGHGGGAPNNNHPSIDYKFFHCACRNERVTEGIIRWILEYFPDAIRFVDEEGRLPLHNICRNKNVTLGMVQLLIDAFPSLSSHESNIGYMPIHSLCYNNQNVDVVLDVLKLLLEKYPGAVRHATHGGILPIHIAARNQSPEFCRILIEAYPGSERMTSNTGMLPFHLACVLNTVATAKYLYKLYPESINVADNPGRYPIHFAIQGVEFREYSPETAVETVKFLLGCDPDVVLRKKESKVLLYWVCWYTTDNDNTPRRINANRVRLNVVLKVLQILYDAHPEAIEDNTVTSFVGEFCAEVQKFINTQLIYARRARDRALMNTRDENGELPLHKALRDIYNATLGSIKLLVNGNPSAISCANNRGMIPLHVACQHHRTPPVVEHLIKLDPTSLRARDFDDNTALHFACRVGNHAIITLLTEKYGAASVSKRNAHGQLPINLLLQNKNEVRDGDEASVKYTESIYRLLRAYPATVMHYDLRQAGSEDCIFHDKKKRKVDELSVK